jgi:peptidoglycan L-alanyl-D-glutamate endopeptidase CwlK
MTFALSERSLAKLQGVDENLIAVVKRAIQISTVDFGVTCGLRTQAEQDRLFASGASQVKTGGKHVLGKAVDLVAYVDNRACWELNLYDDVAQAMRAAAEELKVAVRWGGAWNVPDITKWSGSMEAAMNHYIDTRRKQNQRPFIDAPHFELP